MVNTDLSTSKGSAININKQSHPEASRINIKDDASAVDSKLDSKPAHKERQASNMEVSKCYPVTISNRFQVLDTNQDVQVSSLPEVEVEHLYSHTDHQQLQADSGTQQMLVEPDPTSMYKADPSSVLEY